jgi:acetoin utilization deacetylase AcuC-like enzyme
MGVCYFNSMAVAVQDMMGRGLAKRIAILDLDCHHGNGTEAFCMGKPEFLYLSLHQFPAYPGTGLKSRDNCRNYPLPPGTGEGVYLSALEKAVKEAQTFYPDLVGISIGFDTFEKDPLTQFGLKKKDYRVLGRWMRDLQVPMFALLEGGYHEELPLLVEEFLTGWTS